MFKSKLIVFAVALCSVFSSKAQILCGVEADFVWDLNPNNVPVFIDTSGVAEGWEIISYQWNFGDGSPSSFLSSQSHVFTSIGVFEVCLTVIAQNLETNETCTDMVCQPYVNCGNGNQAMFSVQQNGNSVILVGTSMGTPPLSFVWSYGDGTSGNGPTAEHTYAASGTYVICLTTSSPNGCTNNSCQTVVIQSTFCEGVVADFTVTTGEGFIDVNSTSSAGGDALFYQWLLNGNTSSFSPTITSFSWSNLPEGDYEVCLRLTSSSTNMACDTYCETVFVQGNSLCEGFEVSIIEEANPDGTIALTAITTGGSEPYFYEWSNGATTNSIMVDDLNTELYCVFANDSIQCEAVACDTIEGTCNLELVITTNTGAPNVLQAVVVGGSGDYQYSWSWNSGASNSSILTVNSQGTYCVTVTDVDQCSVTDCYYVGPAMDTLCGYVFNDLNGNGIINANEPGIEGALIQLGNYSAYTNPDGSWQAIVPQGTYYIYYCAGDGNVITFPSSNTSSGVNGNSCANYYGISSNNNNGNCNYNFGVQLVSVNICGNIFFDENDNGTFDTSTESGFNVIHVLLTNASGVVFHAYTNLSGSYCRTVPEGDYTISIAGNPFASCEVNPETISLSTVQGQSYPNQNFAVHCEPGSCNLSVNVNPSTTVSPGFPSWQSIQVCNEGTTISSGTLNYFYNGGVLTYNSATPVPASQSSGTISWNVGNLLPGQCTSFWVNLSAATNTPLGSSVFTLTAIDADCNDFNLVNNTDSLHQVVTGSWDPNNKLAYHTNHEDNTAYQWISSVNSNQRIEYVINFQNTGTAPAVNVVVEDIISSDLDISTLEVLGASHPMQTVINGDDVNFRFNNIMLPDSTNNEPESHGFVRFAINAINGLTPGHIISDYAAIYFDFNEPVITNDAAVEMLDVVSVGEINTSSNVLVYPNPMDNLVQFKNLNGKSFRLRITDAAGRVLSDKQSTTDVYTMERGSLASGFYFYEVIEAEVVTSVGKLVVR